MFYIIIKVCLHYYATVDQQHTANFFLACDGLLDSSTLLCYLFSGMVTVFLHSFWDNEKQVQRAWFVHNFVMWNTDTNNERNFGQQNIDTLEIVRFDIFKVLSLFHSCQNML